MSKLLRRKTPPVVRPANEILLLGCESAGKTLLCRQLERLCSAASASALPLDAKTQPSIGVELLDIVYRKHNLSVREVGGAMQPVWQRYFEGCGAVVLVVDSSTAAGVGSGLIEWYEVTLTLTLTLPLVPRASSAD